MAVKQTKKHDLDELLERFWVQEEIDSTPKCWTREEIECENQFIDTYRRDPNDGRFIIKLPFKNNNVNLGDSSKNAMRRYISLERKFRQDSDYKEIYSKAINELINNGYLEEISPHEIEGEDVFYLPHAGVFKRDPNNPKIRIVYDGSAKSSNGLSLNENLMTGPNLQNDLFAILLRFRTHAVVLSCDMEKMFLQIKIDTKDTKFQLIFWRIDESEPVKVFRLTRLVFGLTNSPYTAMRCVMQLAADMEN
ncbi:hypothetical protein NQ314_003209 [Rhamnusium bicolor]|uniref:Reverse transcriptase domain-containing protein n=1 Tax=Rhamnusium bicolor TaxID=1586634 RepID=A0AAV8ZPI0_9CUCU|nr:hypothetical protein NQ314_003209 [Rhamnusium bicolor]